MMDYYSNFPAPGKPEAIKEVYDIFIKKNLDIDNKLLLDTVTQVITDMPSLGSYTGWYVSFRGDAIKEITTKLNL
jgi:hypothetical protein